jgi:hypothetical protein
MIIRTAKRTIYYPASKTRASDLLVGSRRVRFFRAVALVDKQSLITAENLAPTGLEDSAQGFNPGNGHQSDAP